jgi:hypothetical protein
MKPWHWTVIAIATATLALPTAVRAQDEAGRVQDVATLDGILSAYYEVVSRAAGEPADRARDEWIHHPDALVGIARVGPDDGRDIMTMTLREYHDRFGLPAEEPFYEREIHRVVNRFGSVAHVWSTYASSREPGGEPFSRGINSIQLYHDGSRWWVMSWIFDRERAGNPIPAGYLPE